MLSFFYDILIFGVFRNILIVSTGADKLLSKPGAVLMRLFGNDTHFYPCFYDICAIFARSGFVYFVLLHKESYQCFEREVFCGLGSLPQIGGNFVEVDDAFTILFYRYQKRLAAYCLQFVVLCCSHVLYFCRKLTNFRRFLCKFAILILKAWVIVLM